MFLFKNDFRAHSTKISGVRYITVSFYGGEKDIFQKVTDLIKEDFSSTKADEITKDSLVHDGMVSRYCVCQRRRILMAAEAAAIYCRLSQDDGSVGESGSIQTQKTLLTQYCKEHRIKVRACYADNGWSGTNFDCPNFKRTADLPGTVGYRASDDEGQAAGKQQR